MKKVLIVFAFFIAFPLSFSLFSDTEDKYEVISFTGSVRYQDTTGSWKRLEEGMILAPETIVNVGLNSQLTLSKDGDEFALSAMRRGALSELLEVNTGLRLGNRVQNDDIDTDDVQNRNDISTASTRADDADEEIEWVEE